MKISVVIPCHNSETHLARAVSSVLEQGVAETELIVVDDASSDGTVSLSERLGTRIPSFSLVRLERHSGPGAARNAGLGRARGQYVAFLDSDDAYGGGVFRRVLGDLDRFPWADGVEFAVRLVDAHREVHPQQLRMIANTLPSNIIVRRETAKSVGGFPADAEFRSARIGEDAAYRVALRRWATVGATQEVHLNYTVRRGSNFDRFMDGTRVEDDRIEFLPDEARARIEAATRRHVQRVDAAMLASIGNPELHAISCDIAGRRFTFEVPARPETIAQASATLRQSEYPPLPFGGPVETVLDVDAEGGASAVTFAASFPNARVVALEPTRAAFVLLRRNALAHPNLETFRTSLCNATARLEITHGDTGAREEVLASHPDLLLPSLRLDRIDILQLSNRGLEVPALIALGARLAAIKAIYIRTRNDADRRVADGILAPTHKLFWGRSTRPNHGEFIYAQRALLGPDGTG